MKTKNLLVAGVIIFALYYLLNNKQGDNFQEMGDGNPLDNGSEDLDAVVDGSEPPSLTSDDKKKLFGKALGYRGGARPTDKMLRDADKVKREALARIESLGLMEEFKVFLKRYKSQPVPMNSRPTVELVGSLERR